MKALLVTHFMMGPLLLVIAVLTKLFPPKKINSIYGYRTRRSMQSEDAWREANTYSSNAMIVLAVLVSIFQLFTYWLFEEPVALSLSAGFLVVGAIVMIFRTERHLKSKGFK